MQKTNTRLIAVTTSGLYSIHKYLIVIGICAFIAHCSAMAIKYGLGNDILLGLIPMFDFYEEKNIPTFFSSINLLITAALIFLITHIQTSAAKSHKMAWRILGAGFLFMSLDESSDLRMVLKNLFEFLYQGKGMDATSLGFTVAWTVPVALIVLILAIYFLPFILSLRKIYAINFSLAGLAFIIAALGLENAQGFHAIETQGVRDIYFMALVTIEETLEISSILYFQYFLIRYINEYSSDHQEIVLR